MFFETEDSLNIFEKSYKALFVVDSKEDGTTPFPATIRRPISQIGCELKPLINSAENTYQSTNIFKAFTKLQSKKHKIDSNMQRVAGQGNSKAKEPKKIKIVETPIIAELAKKHAEKDKMKKSLGNTTSYFKPKDNLNNYLGAFHGQNGKFPPFFGNNGFPDNHNTNGNHQGNGGKKKKRNNKKAKGNNKVVILLSMIPRFM